LMTLATAGSIAVESDVRDRVAEDPLGTGLHRHLSWGQPACGRRGGLVV